MPHATVMSQTVADKEPDGRSLIGLRLIGLTLEAARAALADVAPTATVEVVQTEPPLGPRSPLLGATEGGALRVLRASVADGHWVLLVAREQLRA